jgi:hypothetical protein
MHFSKAQASAVKAKTRPIAISFSTAKEEFADWRPSAFRAPSKKPHPTLRRLLLCSMSSSSGHGAATDNVVVTLATRD